MVINTHKTSKLEPSLFNSSTPKIRDSSNTSRATAKLQTVMHYDTPHPHPCTCFVFIQANSIHLLTSKSFTCYILIYTNILATYLLKENLEHKYIGNITGF